MPAFRFVVGGQRLRQRPERPRGHAPPDLKRKQRPVGKTDPEIEAWRRGWPWARRRCRPAPECGQTSVSAGVRGAALARVWARTHVGHKGTGARTRGQVALAEQEVV